MAERKFLYLRDQSVVSAETEPHREVIDPINPIEEIQSDEYGYHVASSDGTIFVDGQIFKDIPGHKPLVRARTGAWHPFKEGADKMVSTGEETTPLVDHRADYRAFLNRQIHEFNERMKS